MSITINIFYHGAPEALKAFADEMISSGTVAKIRAEEGNLGYQYYLPYESDGTLLLIDSWQDQAAIDRHHATEMMGTIAALREKYDLTMTVRRYVSDDSDHSSDDKFIRK